MRYLRYAMKKRKVAAPGWRQGKKAFTLVEMLIVIAIIGVLTAILLPAFNHMAARGNLVKCVGNQKSIVSGIILYANDHDGRLPDYADAHNATESMWWYLIGPYMSAPSTPNRRLGAEFLNCPSAKKEDTMFSYGVNYGAYGESPFSYNSPYWGSPASFPGSKRLSQLSSKTFLVADQADLPGGTAIYSPFQWPLNADSDRNGKMDSHDAFLSKYPYNHLALRHEGRAVFAFPDGSVKAISGKEWENTLVDKSGLWGDTQ